MSDNRSAYFRVRTPEMHRDDAGHSMEGSINGPSSGAGDEGNELGKVFTDLGVWVYWVNKCEGGE